MPRPEGLMPCGKCGSTSLNWRGLNMKRRPKWWRIYCLRCHAVGDRAQTKTEARNRWDAEQVAKQLESSTNDS